MIDNTAKTNRPIPNDSLETDDILVMDDQQMENTEGGYLWLWCLRGLAYGAITCLVADGVK